MRIKLIFILGFVFTVSVNAQVKSIEGFWKGEIVKDGKSWSVEVDICKTKNLLNGAFNLPDYGLYNLTFKTINLNDSVITLFFADKN